MDPLQNITECIIQAGGVSDKRCLRKGKTLDREKREKESEMTMKKYGEVLT